MNDLSRDLFLGGKLCVSQPKVGYRAATDPVLLAASMIVKPGETVLDVGCGVGVASLCLGKRVSDAVLHGLEIQSEYADLAVQNAKENKVKMTVHTGDLCAVPASLREMSFDHVMTNPPYFQELSGKVPRSLGKATAHVETATLADWIDNSLRRVKPLGYFTLIHLVERLPDVLAGLVGKCGGISILPISARAGRPAKRFIVHAKKGGRSGSVLLPPLIMHAGEDHGRDGKDFTDQAVAILRDGQPLDVF